MSQTQTIKTTTHKGFTVDFFENTHQYIDRASGCSYTSATTFISRFFPKFDADAVAERVAPRKGVTPEVLKGQWREAGQMASAEGHAVHAYLEAMANKEEIISMPSIVRHNLPAKQTRIPQLIRQGQEALSELCNRFEVVETEKIIFAPSIMIAGQVDLIMRDPKNGDIIILDWKTNKKLDTSNPWENALPPIAHLENTNLLKYQIQLNLYQKIIETEHFYPNACGYRMAIVHLTPDSNRPIKVAQNDTLINILVNSWTQQNNKK